MLHYWAENFEKITVESIAIVMGENQHSGPSGVKEQRERWAIAQIPFMAPIEASVKECMSKAMYDLGIALQSI